MIYACIYFAVTLFEKPLIPRHTTSSPPWFYLTMAKKLNYLPHDHLLFFFFILLLNLHQSNQLQLSQSQTVLQIQQFLNYPLLLNTKTNDFCNIEPTKALTLSCYEDNITQLHITGNNGGVSSMSVPGSFDVGSFFAVIANLSSLKVLSLVSLGFRGPLPGSVGRLSSLEILNLSSNSFNGEIPAQLSSLKNLQTVVLDYNRFTGQVPGWISSLQELSVLSLKNNSLTGSLPGSISNLKNLRVLHLSTNYLSGEVPDLHNLTNLQVLDLENNHFGPHFPNLHNKLVSLLFRNNSFRFGIPVELASYYQLKTFDVSMNRFVGPFPSLFSLPSITHLDISGNKLTGMLFENMSCSSELGFIDLSSNLLTGDLPGCLMKSTSRNNTSVVLYAGNCLSNDEQPQNPSSFCHKEALAVTILPDEEKHKKSYHKRVFASSMVGGAFVCIAVAGLVFMVLKYNGKNVWRYCGKDSVTKKSSTRLITEKVSIVNTAKLLTDARYISQTMKLGASLPAYRTFSLEELKDATHNFDASTIISQGSSGKNYKGILSDGTKIVIRGLKTSKRHNPHTYTHHIEMISKLRHNHLVSVLGHCIECYPDDSAVSTVHLVFEFLPNGSLRSCISGNKGQKFTWMQRIAAIIGVTKGVQFLHTGIVPGVFSNNLKITDVLLDQDIHVKISTYNLPLLSEHKGTGVPSTGSKTNTYKSEMQEDKNDIFDIGVILLEIITGRAIMSRNEIILLKDSLEVGLTINDATRRSMVDPTVRKECSDESLKTILDLCLRCLSEKPAERPSVEDVIWNLKFAAQVQDSWQGDYQNDQELPVPCFQEV